MDWVPGKSWIDWTSQQPLPYLDLLNILKCRKSFFFSHFIKKKVKWRLPYESVMCSKLHYTSKDVRHRFIPRSDSRPQPTTPTTDTPSQCVLDSLFCLPGNLPPPPTPKMKLCCIRFGWSGEYIFRENYIFCRRRLLDFLWVLKKQG